MLMGGPTHAQAAELLVSAAVSLTQALREITVEFERVDPSVQVRLNLAASGALVAQIAKGAPADVLVSADKESMDQAQSMRLLLEASRRDISANRLVVAVPAAAKRSMPRNLHDLATERYARVAIGLPASVPAGRYARAALQTAGLWESVKAKMIGASSVRQALDYVARGEVDAGFVYATDAATMPDRVKVAFAVTTTEPIVYPAAALAGAPNRALALQFMTFLASPQAQAILARYGFEAP
jgi:molybdate transport system substrate-binding protein